MDSRLSNRRQWFSRAAALAASAIVAHGAEKKGMRILSARPEDLEMPMEGFRDWITPVEHFFVRSHHYTPTVDAAAWRLTVAGKVTSPLTLTLEELKAMPALELVAVLECAGNGRGLYEPSMPGLQWQHGGVGNGRWRGVRLRDVLKRAGVQPEGKHVLFDGADVPVGKQPEFQRTIPLSKALADQTLLAYEMNGAPLDPSHGFPLRVVVPGWAGDSWVKWVTRVEVLDREFDGFFMKTAYRHPGRGVEPGVPVKPEEMRPVEEIQVKSIIAETGPAVRGVAYAGETPVARVEISLDNGRTWKAAKLTSPKTRYGWVSWEYSWQPPSNYYTVMARAFDTQGRTQPYAPEWNPSGYQWNVVHRVAANAQSKPVAAAEVAEPAGFRNTCLVCHGEQPISQQRLSRAQWDAEVAKMERWGAAVKPELRSAIVDYLASRFGYRPR